MMTFHSINQVFWLLNSRFSGGAKLAELIPLLVENGWKEQDIVDLPDAILAANNPLLKVLVYTCKSGGLSRKKFFIYTP